MALSVVGKLNGTGKAGHKSERWDGRQAVKDSTKRLRRIEGKRIAQDYIRGVDREN